MAEVLPSGKPWQPQLQGAQLAAAQANWSLFDLAAQALLRQFGNQPQALQDLAALMLNTGQLSAAEALLHWCHQLEPCSHAPLLNLANLWLQSLRHAQALALYAQLNHSSNLLMALGYQVGQPAAAARHWARRWAAEQLPACSVCPTEPSSPHTTPLRLGFLSADLCQHPVGLFLWPLVEQLASQHPQIQLVFYDNSPRSDWLSQHLQACGLWRRIHELSDDQLAAQIRADELWALIELGGHTARNRLPVLLRRAAPRQFSWLGYWATTGLAEVLDGVLVDSLLVPPGSAEQDSFDEPLCFLAQGRWCYRPVPWMPDVVDPPCLARRWVTFGSFNSAAKLNQQVLHCWAAVLKAVPGSRLLLKNYQLQDAGLRQRLGQMFAAQGVDPARLILEGPCFHAELLAAYSQVDIALDPFPFNGGLTSCEALWQGLPLVSLAGEDQAAVMASRQGLAMLQLIGRPEWIAVHEDQYVALAVSLASDPTALRELRHGQRARIQASPLCDELAFTRAFLAAIGLQPMEPACGLDP